MDPNTQTSQEDNQDMEKQNISETTPVNPVIPETPASSDAQTIPVQEQPLIQNPVANPEIPQQTDVPPMETPIINSSENLPPENVGDSSKKSSPVLVISLIVLVVSILFLGGFYLWTTYSSGSSKNAPIATMTPTIKPTTVPTMTPEATISATPTSSESATPTLSASPSASPL